LNSADCYIEAPPLDEALISELHARIASLEKDFKALQTENAQLKRKATLEERTGRDKKRQSGIKSFFASNKALPTKQRCSVVEEEGTGYSKNAKGVVTSAFRRDLAEIESLCLKLAKGDPLKEMQLAEATACRFGIIRKSLVQDHEAWDAVSESLKYFFATLRQKYRGRYPNSIRAVQQGVCSAISNRCTKGQLAVVSKEFGVPEDKLVDGQSRFLEWFDGDREKLVDFRGAVRSDKLPEEWVELAVRVWTEETRRSEKTKDSIRHPHNRADKTSYRIHYMEERLSDIHKKVIVEGKKVYGNEFHMSHIFTAQCKPFWVKDATREVCLCIYHLRFELMCEALYN
jgi:hypothetical protein